MLWLALGIIAAVAVIGVGSALAWYCQLKQDERDHTFRRLD